MGNFIGTLNANHIQSALFNMIISQDIIGGSIKNNYNLVDKAKEEAGLLGDKKLYIDTPNITPVDWVQDSEEAVNLLKLARPAAPKTQEITIDVFKQAAVTKDSYLSKQAFGTEGAFVAYQGVLDSRLVKSKEVYLNKTYNTFIGTVKGNEKYQTFTPIVEECKVDAGGNSTGENIALFMANLIDDMKDYNTRYTINGFERAFGDEDIHIVWNNKFVNAVRKIDLPSVFHDEALQATFKGDVLPSRYFGEVNAHTTSTATDRAMHDLYITYDTNKVKYVAAGDLIGAGYTITAGDAYTEDEDIICKVFTKFPPVLEAFTVGTSFYNPKNLSTTNYYTFGHNTLEVLASEAVLTVKKDTE